MAMPELIEAPLSADELAARYRALCADPCYANGGRAFVEVSVLTTTGVLVADVAWASDDFMRLRGFETPYLRAPELRRGGLAVWIVFPQSKRCEFLCTDGLMERSRHAVDLAGVFS